MTAACGATQVVRHFHEQFRRIISHFSLAMRTPVHQHHFVRNTSDEREDFRESLLIRDVENLITRIQSQVAFCGAVLITP
eukprot:5104028-Pleurochrysis_carterae.AAC.1